MQKTKLLIAFFLLGCSISGYIHAGQDSNETEQRLRQSIVNAYPEMDEETKQGLLDGTLDRQSVVADLERKRDEKKGDEKNQKVIQSVIDAYPEMDEETKQGLLNGTLERQSIVAELEQKRDERAVAARRARYIKEHPRLGPKTKTAIAKGKIIIGMNEEQVIASWGEADEKNRTAGSWGMHEQWIYGTSYLYFENGKLTSWQD